MVEAEQSIEVCLAPELLPIFFPLFQAGVFVEVETGCTIKQLLVEQFGISADYLAGRITTLFLNHKAIDDAATAIVNNGSVLALSGAMPGLVGATMRSGGHLAAMRGAMTYSNEEQDSQQLRGCIKIKLFNLLLPEIGPRLLRWGIIVCVSELKNFFLAQPEEFRLRGCRIDGRPVATDIRKTCQEFPADNTMVKLTVSFGEQ